MLATQVYGLDEGGDANELRLLSTDEKLVNINAIDGQVDIVGTRVGALRAAMLEIVYSRPMA